MASEPLAIARPEAPVEDDYGILSAALEASARGRAFLSEHARRNRSADTEVLLAAIDRLSAQIRGDAEALQHMRAELRTLVTAIRLARPDIDAGRPPGKMAMLGELVGLVERRIDVLIGETRTGDPQPARPQLAVVPAPDEPELPIPSPDAQAPAMAVVAPAKPVAAVMPEVNVLDSSPPPASPPVRPRTPSADRLRVLAPIMALSEDERLALFS
jgi:hypothetical protein